MYRLRSDILSIFFHGELEKISALSTIPTATPGAALSASSTPGVPAKSFAIKLPKPGKVKQPKAVKGPKPVKQVV